MNHMEDVMMEPNPKMAFGESILKMEGLSECHLTNTNISVGSQASPGAFLSLQFANL
jgi:hypothetical protein